MGLDIAIRTSGHIHSHNKVLLVIADYSKIFLIIFIGTRLKKVICNKEKLDSLEKFAN